MQIEFLNEESHVVIDVLKRLRGKSVYIDRTSGLREFVVVDDFVGRDVTEGALITAYVSAQEPARRIALTSISRVTVR